MNGRTNGTTSETARAQNQAVSMMSGEQQATSHHLNSNPRFDFRKAVKRDAKLRLALLGPSGSGKTYTLLTLATELGGPVAVIDTERGSAEKYADLFDFDVLPLASFDPRQIPPAIDAAHKAGYRALIIDSLSHFYNGVDGELEQVDRVKARLRDNGFAAWKEVTPMHNRLLDAMISAPIHVLVSMRVKTEWIVETDDRGKSKPRKVGLQPIMRDGIEYEFDVCGDMDTENNLIITKSRCPELSGQVFAKPGAKMAGLLKTWLASPEPAAKPPAPPKPPQTVTASAAPDGNYPWHTIGQAKTAIINLREAVGETEYADALAAAGVQHPGQFTLHQKDAILRCYQRLCAIAGQREVA